MQRIAIRSRNAVGLSLGALALVVGLSACAPEEETQVSSDILAEGVDTALEDMDLYVTREGVRRARLRPPSLRTRSSHQTRFRSTPAKNRRIRR